MFFFSFFCLSFFLCFFSFFLFFTFLFLFLKNKINKYARFLVIGDGQQWKRARHIYTKSRGHPVPLLFLLPSTFRPDPRHGVRTPTSELAGTNQRRSSGGQGTKRRTGGHQPNHKLFWSGTPVVAPTLIRRKLTRPFLSACSWTLQKAGAQESQAMLLISRFFSNRGGQQKVVSHCDPELPDRSWAAIRRKSQRKQRKIMKCSSNCVGILLCSSNMRLLSLSLRDVTWHFFNFPSL